MNKEAHETSWPWKSIFTIKVTAGLVICIILALLVTLPFITKPIYESEAIVYVPLVVPNQQLNQQGVGFADEHEIDSYIQILKSNIMTDSLIKHFGLQTDPQINISDMYKKLESRIKIEKTRYGSVSIKIRDNNPEKASEMANYIIRVGEIIKRDLLFPNREEAMLYAKSFFEQKAEEVAGLEKTIDSLEHIGTIAALKNNFKYNQALDAYKLEFKELISRKNQYERAKKDFEAPLPKVYIVSRAMAIDQKVWPRRGLLCISVAIVYLLVVLAVEIITRDIVKK